MSCRRSLVSYSDGYGGQNKNQTIIGLYSDLHLNDIYEVLDHKYLVRGHTFLENDRDFAQIEKRKKSAVVYLPGDWSNRKPFVITEMPQENFLDFKGHISSRYRKRWVDRNKQPVSLRRVHWLNFGWGEESDPSTGEGRMVHHPTEVWMRYGFDKNEPWKKVKLLQPGAERTSQPQRLYSEPLLINPHKIKDLKAMAEKYIPSPQRDFYLQLDATPTHDSDSWTDAEDSEHE